MTSWRRKRPSVEQAAAYLEGELAADERARFEAELEGNRELQRSLEQLRTIRDVLSVSDPALDSMDLSLGVQLALRKPSPPSRWRRPHAALRGFAWGRRAAGGALAAAAALSLGVVLLRDGEAGQSEAAHVDAADWSEAAFRAKAVELGPAPGRWAGVQVYRLGAGGSPTRVGEHVAASDGLLFAYTNLGLEPFAYLMVFALGATGQVYWYHPAHERAGEEPQSVAIQPQRAQEPMPEVIRHELAPGPLALHALFSRRPLRVSQVEAWLAERAAGGAAAPVPDAHVQVIDVQVQR